MIEDNKTNNNKKWILAGVIIVLFGLFLLTSYHFNKDEFFSIENKIPNFNEGIIKQGTIDLINNNLTIKSNNKEWVITKYTGIESDFELHFLNSKNKSTRICFTPKQGINVTGNTGDRLLLDINNNPILDDTNKEISLKYESNKCDINGVKFDGYTVDLSTAKMINVNDYVKFGNNSIVIEYQDINTLNYNSNWFDLNISLAVNLTGEFDSTVNDIWVFTSGKNNKFGANFNSSNVGDLQFKYIVNSNKEIKKKDNRNYIYYIYQSVPSLCGSLPCTKEERHEFDFKDICKPKINKTIIDIDNHVNDGGILFDPQCSFNLNNNDLEITFLSEYDINSNMYFIDPSISISDVSTSPSTLTNVTCETGFCHLNINDSNLILYVPFDPNVSATTVYDYSSNNIDGTVVNEARFNSSGIFGGDFEFDGINDYVNFGNHSALNFERFDNITISYWIKYADDSAFKRFLGRQTDASGNRGWQIESLGGASNVGQFTMASSSGPSVAIRSRSTTAFVAGTYYHITIVYNGTSTAAGTAWFVNGVREPLVVQTDTLTTTISIPSNEFQLGVRDDDITTVFNGSLDEIMIWNRDLSDTEVLDLFNNKSSLFFSSGSQEFRENDITSGDFINITINSTTVFGSSINVSLGNVSGTTYDFGNQFIFTNNVAVNIPLGDANNFSLKYHYYSGNDTNPFKSSTLENDINIVSWSELIIDTEYPLFSTFTETPSNNSVYSSGALYSFNTTISSTNGTTGLEFNGINYTATNFLSIFNLTVLDLGVGNYSYYWWSYGNGTASNFNTSSLRYYAVSKKIPSGSLSGTTPIDFGTAGDVQGSESNVGDNDVTYNLYRDNVSVSNPDTSTLGAGSYSYIYNTTGGQNYSENASLDTFILVINKIASEINLTLNSTDGNITIIQNASILLNGTLNLGDPSGVLTLSNDGTNINSGVNEVSNDTQFDILGEFNITVIYSATQNYTQGSKTYYVTVNDNLSPGVNTLTETPSDPSTYIQGQTYGFNITITETNPLDTIILTFNSINYTATNIVGDVYNVSIVDLPAGVFTYNWFVNDSSGNINNSEGGTYTILNATGNINLFLNGIEANLSVVYPQETNLTAVTSFGTHTILRDGVDITSENGINITRGVNFYNITATSSGDANHSSVTVTYYLDINKASSEVNLTLNSTEGNITILVGSSILLNGTLITGDAFGTLRLFNNLSIINSNNTEVSNSTTFNSVGEFNITVIYDTTQNFTRSIETYYVNVTPTPDITPPAVDTLTETPSDPVTYSLGATYEFNATITDITAVETVILTFNGTNYIATNIAGDLYNVSIVNLPVGVFNYTWYANDTLGNVNNTVVGTYTINRATSIVNLTINHSDLNITVNNATALDLNGSLILGEGNIELFYNLSSINFDSSPIHNLTQFNQTGVFNITLIHPQTQNYTSGTDTIFVTVQGTLTPPKAANYLQMWRNSSSKVNVSTIDNNGNWFILNSLNVTGTGYFSYLGSLNLRMIDVFSTNINVINISATNYHSFSGSKGISNTLIQDGGLCNQTYESGILISFVGCT